MGDSRALRLRQPAETGNIGSKPQYPFIVDVVYHGSSQYGLNLLVLPASFDHILSVGNEDMNFQPQSLFLEFAKACAMTRPLKPILGNLLQVE